MHDNQCKLQHINNYEVINLGREESINSQPPYVPPNLPLPPKCELIVFYFSVHMKHI